MNHTIKHIAMIMDGNGRWAKAQGKQRQFGHEAGAKTARAITQIANTLGISYLTLYAFSTENWKRPKLEVEFLMKLLQNYLQKELPIYVKNNIRFEYIGDLSPFSGALKKTLLNTKEATAQCTGLTQVLAVNYGAQDEIVRAVNKAVALGKEVTQESFNALLDTGIIPPVDLLIRTGGDMRLSNFLLWQAAYAELFFTSTLWPDFGEEEFLGILKNFEQRERRFGGL